MSTTDQPKLRDRLEVFDILDRLQSLSDGGAKLPMTNRVLINPLELRDIVAKLKRALPRDITEAQQIIRSREAYLAQAQGEAKRIRTIADQEAMNKVAETQIVENATKAAEQLRAEAQASIKLAGEQIEKQTRDRMAGADQYAIEVLRKLEEELNTLLLTARRGLESLQSGRELDDADR